MSDRTSLSAWTVLFIAAIFIASIRVSCNKQPEHKCLCEENRKLIQATNRRLSLFLRDQAPPSDLEDYLLEEQE